MRILHYNDEETQLHDYLQQLGHENVIVAAGDDPFEVVRSQSQFDAAFVGLHPHGLRLLRVIRQHQPQCFVTIITADTDARQAVGAIKAGAFDYLMTPLDFTEVERICLLLTRQLADSKQTHQLKNELAAAQGNGGGRSTSELIGQSKPMRQLRQLIDRAANSTAPVLITGQTGTGKELVARMLHERSMRKDNPFVSINCNAIPTQLLESELFGYKKGSFTGADHDRQGLLEQADGGTFLFDEISDLDMSLQGKILRVLQEGEVRPLGSKRVKHLDIRFLAATNQDLPTLVEAKKFRDDLYYRLDVLPIRILPLAQRKEDVAPLVRHFLDIYCAREGRSPLKVTEQAWRKLAQYPWPGNVRELENLCHRAVVLTQGNTLDVDGLSLTQTLGKPETAHFQPISAIHGDVDGDIDLRASRNQLERQTLEQVLLKYQGNISNAAKKLGMSRTTFYAKAKKYNINLKRRLLGATQQPSMPAI